jgi:subtilisin
VNVALERAAGANAAPPAVREEHPAWLRRAVGAATGRGVHVAVLDSGVDPAWGLAAVGEGVGLLDRGETGYRLRPSADVTDLDGHGTACIDILNRAAPGAVLHPVRLFHRRRQTSPEVLLAGLRWAVERRMDVVNLSLCTLDRSLLVPLYRACEEARLAGVLVVAAADGRYELSLPAVFGNTIGVAAGRFTAGTDYRYRPESAIECLAEGRADVRWRAGGRRLVEASSYAAPRIAGLVARFLEGRPRAGLADVHELLARHALDGPGRTPDPELGDPP